MLSARPQRKNNGRGQGIRAFSNKTSCSLRTEGPGGRDLPTSLDHAFQQSLPAGRRSSGRIGFALLKGVVDGDWQVIPRRSARGSKDRPKAVLKELLRLVFCAEPIRIGDQLL